MTKPKNNNAPIVQQSTNSNLVRPKTVMQEHKLRNRRSFVTLSLCGACLFLLILCGCLIASLVLVGKSLSKTDRQQQAVVDVIASLSDNILSTVTANDNKVILKTTLKNSVANNSSEQSNRVTMNVPKMSKIIDQLSWRLPKEIKPILYELTLKPDLTSKTFSGNIDIHLSVTKPISYIAVHAHTLAITKTLLQSKNATNGARHNVTIAHAFAYPQFQYWVTEVPTPLDAGDYVLGLAFNGSLENRIVGFYQSTYVNPTTNQSRYNTTPVFLSFILVFPFIWLKSNRLK